MSTSKNTTQSWLDLILGFKAEAQAAADDIKRQPPEVRSGDVYAFLPESEDSILYLVVLGAEQGSDRYFVTAADDSSQVRNEIDYHIGDLRPGTGSITLRADLVGLVPASWLDAPRRVGWLDPGQRECVRLHMETVTRAQSGCLDYEFDLLEVIGTTRAQWSALMGKLDQHTSVVMPWARTIRIAAWERPNERPAQRSWARSEPQLYAEDAFHEALNRNREANAPRTHRLLFCEFSTPIELVASPRWGVRLKFDAAPGQEPPRVTVCDQTAACPLEWERPAGSSRYSTVGTVKWVDGSVKLHFELGHGSNYAVLIERLAVVSNVDRSV